MIGLAYLGALAVSAAGMVILDWRYRLTFFRRPGFSALAVLGMTLFFLAWDVVGISTGIFLRGETEFMTGIDLGPELPLEEPVFLAFLSYLTLNVAGLLNRAGRADRRDSEERADRSGRAGRADGTHRAGQGDAA
ncbi:lycopene cyclase domain-containing protein [Rothia sp. AR01]|uniref:Lycopene cyclase domain-containing protein n=1 Tax=Rothia santali TaxID=2949643 RepID=A0A9X2HCI4_9MICC|nr:lycopene cyclase domain-containing protein [Rothia santali]MCP3425615.1 lycopene cyclase domain-containing protein [Rothia santali]